MPNTNKSVVFNRFGAVPELQPTFITSVSAVHQGHKLFTDQSTKCLQHQRSSLGKHVITNVAVRRLHMITNVDVIGQHVITNVAVIRLPMITNVAARRLHMITNVAVRRLHMITNSTLNGNSLDVWHLLYLSTTSNAVKQQVLCSRSRSREGLIWNLSYYTSNTAGSACVLVIATGATGGAANVSMLSRDWLLLFVLRRDWSVILLSVKVCQHIDIVTFIPRFPLSANSCAMFVSNTRQSLFMIADCTPSWMLRGVASQVKRRRWPFNSSLQ